MICAIITPLLPNRNRIPEKLSCLAISFVGLMSAYLLYALTEGGQSLSFNFAMGHFPAPWGNELRAGPLEAVLSLVFCVAMLLSLTGNFSSTAEDIAPKRRNIFCVLVNLLTASLLALTYTNDLFTAYVFIEINTIAACAIVAVKESAETVRAALRYLVMSLVGSGLVMIAICLLYDLTGHLLMQNMHRAIGELVATKRYMIPLTVSLALITAGLAIKSALYPFASWLPDAHGSSTNASSAILSGLVLKGHIFTIIKIFYRVFGLDVIHFLRMDTVIFILGITAMIMGSVHALRQKNVKRMIAWSSVAQVGYIFMGVGLGMSSHYRSCVCEADVVHGSRRTQQRSRTQEGSSCSHGNILRKCLGGTRIDCGGLLDDGYTGIRWLCVKIEPDSCVIRSFCCCVGIGGTCNKLGAECAVLRPGSYRCIDS